MDHIELLPDATRRFAGELRTGDLDAAVPACPGWTLADLGEHLRSVHLWAAHAVTDGTPDGQPEPGMLDRPSLVAGYRAAAGHLVEVLTRTPIDAPVWAFGPEPRVAAFWRRRQAHETWLHLYDALATSGREADWAIPAELAWDGVDEVVAMFYPRQVRLERTTRLTGTLRLRATDLGEVLDLGEGDPAVEMADTADRLLLMLWGRIERPAEVASLLGGATITP